MRSKDEIRFDLDGIHAEIHDQNVALEQLQEFVTQQDDYGLAIIIRSIKENIRKQLELLENLTMEFRQTEQ